MPKTLTLIFKLVSVYVISLITTSALLFFQFMLLAESFISLGCSSSCRLKSTVSIFIFLSLLVSQFIFFRRIFKLRKIVILVLMLLCVPSIIMGLKIHYFVEQWGYIKSDENYRKEAVSKMNSVSLSSSYIENNTDNSGWCLVTPVSISQSINSKALAQLLKPRDYRKSFTSSCSGSYYEYPPVGYNITLSPPSVSERVFFDSYFDYKNKLIPIGDYYLTKCFSTEICTQDELDNIQLEEVQIVPPDYYKVSFWDTAYTHLIK